MSLSLYPGYAIQLIIFANPNFIPRLMKELEQKYLAKFTPCRFSSINELAYALGVVHVELILIHPFREGNGRIARLLTNIMVAQAGRSFIDYSSIDRTSSHNMFDRYISAIQEGNDENYKKISEIFTYLLKASC